MATITGLASSRIKATLPYFVASSAIEVSNLRFIVSNANTYEFAVRNPTSTNTTAYIRAYTIYV